MAMRTKLGLVGLMATFQSLLLRGAAGQLTLTSNGECTTDLDCALLGACVGGWCQCDEGWKGANCQYPDLLPQTNADIDGYDYHASHPTWGARSIYANGEYHLISTYIVNRCDVFADYGTNSAFLRATSQHPAGPWTFKEEVLPPFHHGAHVERYVDGTYLIYGDGRPTPKFTVKTNCAVAKPNKEDDVPPARRMQAAAKKKGKKPRSNVYPRGDSPNDVHIVAYASSMEGPWTEFQLNLRTDMSRGLQKWDCNITNFAPWVLPNGTVVMGFRAKPCNECTGHGCQRIGIAVSHTGFKGPFVKRESFIPGLEENEDPYLWKSERGWHFIFHGKTQCGSKQSDTNTCGTYAYSRDSFEWFLSPFPFYDENVFFDTEKTGKIVEKLEYRHRPKMVFDAFGNPSVLYNSGQRFRDPYQRNFAFTFNTDAMRNFRPPAKCIKPFTGKGSCTADNKGKKRNFKGCSGLHESCFWCASTNTCVFGSDDRFCNTKFPEKLLAHCPGKANVA